MDSICSWSWNGKWYVRGRNSPARTLWWKWLTESGHLFGQVSTESPKQAAVGQQVKGGVASHGVEGEGVDSRWEAGHMTHLLFPVGSHGSEAHPGVCGRPLGESSSSHNTWKSPDKLKSVSFRRLSGCGEWMSDDEASGFSDSTLEGSSNSLFWGRQGREICYCLLIISPHKTWVQVFCDWHEHDDTISGLFQEPLRTPQTKFTSCQLWDHDSSAFWDGE